jgi:rhamnose transport system permease protein
MPVRHLRGLGQRLHHHRFKVPPLIATLATLALYRGLAEGISEARSVRGYPEWFFFFGQGEVLGVPFQLWLLGIATVIAPSCSA